MPKVKTLFINKRAIGPGHPCYIIAELSANHRQEFECAVELIKAAKKAGADAVKLQTYTPDTITIDSDNPLFRHGNKSPWANQSLYQLYRQAYTPWEWHPQLKKIADKLGIDLFSSPFDPTAVEFLERMDVPAYKISSFEIVDIPLIQLVAKTGKPLILSTGMATKEEIADALYTASAAGANEIALLKCSSAYPAPITSMNLKTIVDMAEHFKVPVGLSDHTLGTEAALISVSLGANIIEKHFTLSRAAASADAAFSLEPEEFKQMVSTVRYAEQTLGTVHYGPTEAEIESLGFRRSLFVVRDIPSGNLLTAENIRSIRPAGGLAPREYHNVLGRRTCRFLSAGTPLRWEDLQ